MERKKQLAMGIILISIAVSLIIGFLELYMGGPLGELILRKETVSMALELGLVFVLFLLILHRCDKSAQLIWMVIIMSIFAWIHQIFTPVAVSGMYAIYLVLLGKLFKRIVNHGRKDSIDFLENGIIDFMLGCGVFISVVCLASLAGAGSIYQLQKLVILSGAVLAAWELIEYREDLEHMPLSLCRKDKLLIAVVLTMALLQAGRMNLALDYDSLHYGLRSEYILNSGRGIYENPGLNNVVYTYSKGLEVLLLPLSGLRSHSYILSFNLWVMAGVLTLIYKIVRKFAPLHFGWLAAAFASAMPGIMNMGITAKTDMITLLFQLMFIYYVVCYIKYNQNRYLVFALGAFLITFTFKPTALVFSGIMFLAALFWLFLSKRFHVKIRDRWWFALFPILAAWLGIWARTWILTGVPVTSVFTGIFETLGFQIKYPFAFGGIPGNGGDVFSAEGMVHWIRRIYGILFAPAGEDMDHVIIAWGTGLVLVLAIILITAFCLKRGEENHDGEPGLRYLSATLFAIAGASLISVRMLWQVDGNYFILLYALLAVLGGIVLGRMSDKSLSGRIVVCLLPLMLFNFSVTLVTNWAGAVGFSPVSLVHRGYFDHREQAYARMAENGNEMIWQELAANPQTRVLAVGEEPEVLAFPCNIQTYNDVTGSGGDVVLVKTLDHFKDFLRYAKTEYIYVQAGFVSEGTRVCDVLRYMIEDGSLTDVRTEHGNVIARVNLDGGLPAAPVEDLKIFDENYYFNDDMDGERE